MGEGGSSEVQYVPSICEALGLISSTTKKCYIYLQNLSLILFASMIAIVLFAVLKIEPRTLGNSYCFNTSNNFECRWKPAMFMRAVMDYKFK
jgi:hypothetical protein